MDIKELLKKYGLELPADKAGEFDKEFRQSWKHHNELDGKAKEAGRIMMLVHDEVKPDTQRVLDLLGDYRVDHRLGIEEMYFMRQVNHFLGAKKSEGMAKLSTYSYRMRLDMFHNHINKAADITTNDIRDFITYLGEVRGNKISTIQVHLSILRSFFTWMHNEELIPRNPTTRIKSFRINKKDSRHPLTNEQLEMLRNACVTYREKALIELLYSSGCRVSEAEQINLNDIDFEQRSVSIIGKGSKRRTIYFSIRALLMIKNYLLERKGGTALFCCTRAPYDRLGTRSIQKLIRQLGERGNGHYNHSTDPWAQFRGNNRNLRRNQPGQCEEGIRKVCGIVQNGISFL